MGEARKIAITSADVTVTPTFEMSGSMLAGTARHRLVSIASHLDLKADADRATISAIVDQAERMCFVIDAIENLHTVQRSVTINGT